MNKLIDIIYANFAQLSYINWNSIKKGTDLKDAMFDIKKKNTNKMSVNTRHIFMVYSEDKKWESPIWDECFNGWEFIYCADSAKIMREYLKIVPEQTENNGFYAVAFKKDNNIVVAFRGTDDLLDVQTDLEIAFFNKFNPQLSCADWFVRHLRENLGYTTDTYEYHYTGHSLGGALAQYAFVVDRDMFSKAVTWNALGIGEHLKDLKETFFTKTVIDMLEILNVPNATIISKKILDAWNREMVLNHITDIVEFKSDFWTDMKKTIQNIIISEGTSYIRNEEFTTVFEKDSNFFDNLKIKFGFGPSKKYNERMETKLENMYKIDKNVNVDLMFNLDTVTYKLQSMLTLTYMFCTRLAHKRKSTDCINYVFPDDWVCGLQTRIGMVYDVTTAHDGYIDTPKQFDYTDDSKTRILLNTINCIGFDKHSTANFILYMNNEGNISPGIIREVFLDNICKDFIKTRIFKPPYNKFIRIMSEDSFVIDSDYTRYISTLPAHIHDSAMFDKKFDTNMNSKYVHWNEYKLNLKFYELEFNLTKDLVSKYFLIGRWNNLVFDGINGKSNPIKIYVQKK